MNSSKAKGHPLDAFYTKIYRRYDIINRLFTLGMDVKWRKITAQKCLSLHPQSVIDLCCGTADLAITVKQLSDSRDMQITGYDFNENMLSIGREKAQKNHLKNMEFIQGDAAKMPFQENSFDSMTIGFGFRNLTYENPYREKHLSEMSRILKSGASLFILESGVPTNIFVRFFYNLYLKLILIPIGTLVSGDRKAYTYLAKSSSNFFHANEVKAMLSAHGFSEFELTSFLFGAANLLKARKS